MFKITSVTKTFKKKRTFKDVLKSFWDWIRSAKVHLFISIIIFSSLPVIAVDLSINYYYRQSMIESEIAKIQNMAAVTSRDFSDFASLTEASSSGVYNTMVKYSTLNSVRIRIVDMNFVIQSDSYSATTGHSLVNSRLISAFNSQKSLSGYDKATGTIEAVVPLINGAGQHIGMFIMDLDISNIDSFLKMVIDKTNLLEISVITLIFAIAFVFVRLYFSPFKKVDKEIEEVANGHTDKRLEGKHYSELKTLSDNFNMIMDKSNALDKSRQEFVSNVSHELKTPITSIKVLADSLNMQEDVPIELYKEFMQDITNEIDRESKIIDDLLSLVRMDKSASHMNITSVNLNELLEIVLKRLKPIAQKKNIEILFESFRPVVAEIDEVKFTQVVSNLVENAIKYNKIDGWVHVSLNADYQYFYVRVEDSGIGIPQENQDMVFERFYRVDKARSRETGGTGLGLAIVKNIILLHHGTVKLHSEEGSGTTFTVRIPLKYVE